MKNSARRALLVATLLTIAVGASACDAAAAEGLGQLALQFYGGVAALGVALLIIIASLPKP